MTPAPPLNSVSCPGCSDEVLLAVQPGISGPDSRLTLDARDSADGPFALAPRILRSMPAEGLEPRYYAWIPRGQQNTVILHRYRRHACLGSQP